MTKIEWVRNSDGTKGKTWNPVTGCTKVSVGCAHCYAERMARRLAGRYGYPSAPNHFDVTLRPNRLGQPLKWRKPKMVFVCSMSDLFHEDVPDDFICDVFYTMSQAQHHTFVVLTKRPERMYNWFNRSEAQGSKWHKPLPNVIGMVTAENQKQADKRIPWLLQCPFSVCGVSVEPMLEPVNLRGISDSDYCIDALTGDVAWMESRDIGSELMGEPGPSLDWVICGPETGPGARGIQEFEPRARGLRNQCVEAGVPFFLKKNTNGTRQIDGREWNEMPGGYK